MISYMADTDSSILKVLRALANPNRLKIVEWLAAPQEHFPPQIDGDLVEDGVCVANIVKKLELAQPTVTSHMRVLVDAGLVTSKPIKNWVFYRLDEAALAMAWQAFSNRMDITPGEE